MRVEDLYQAIGAAKPEYLEQSEYSAQKHRRKPVLRGLLIAAVIAAIGGITALAVSFSLRDIARKDMGITEENPIAEWTEYGEDKTTGTNTEQAGEAAGQAVLSAAMCSGSQLYAYLEVSPIDTSLAEALTNRDSAAYEWDLGGVQPQGCSYYVEQIGYDPETQTALVKAELSGDILKQAEQMTLKLYLKHDLQSEAVYGPVTIPITESQMFSHSVDIRVENRKDHLDLTANGLNAGHFPDYSLEGRITCLTLCASYLEVTLEAPGLDQWVPVTGLEKVKITVPAETLRMLEEHGSTEAEIQEIEQQLFLEDQFVDAWARSVNEALAGAAIHYKDGSSQMIEEIPSAFNGVWLLGSGAIDDSMLDGNMSLRFTPQKPFDLSAVTSITIGDSEYDFQMER
jgi:hypothetical protein